MKEQKSIHNSYKTVDENGNEWNLFFKQHETIKHRCDLVIKINEEEITIRKFPRYADAHIMSVYLDKIFKKEESDIAQDTN